MIVSLALIPHKSRMNLDENGVSASTGPNAQGAWVSVIKTEDS